MQRKYLSSVQDLVEAIEAKSLENKNLKERLIQTKKELSAEVHSQIETSSRS